MKPSNRESIMTPKQEKFAQAYIETGNASEAFRRAYPRSEKWKPEVVNVKASELLKHGKVLVRIRELQADHLERHKITIDSLTADARRAIKLAENNGQAGPYVAALKFIAQMHGLLEKKPDVTINEIHEFRDGVRKFIRSTKALPKDQEWNGINSHSKIIRGSGNNSVANSGD
jgi:phage terminase small subunit